MKLGTGTGDLEVTLLVSTCIDHLRTSTGTRSFPYAGINQWRGDMGRHQPYISWGRPENFGAGMNLSESLKVARNVVIKNLFINKLLAIARL